MNDLSLNTGSTEGERRPIVFSRDGDVFANSRDVATYFGKAHRHVIDAIESLLKSEPKLGLRNFRHTPYVEKQNGQTYKSYDMDETGFSLLAMGFTGVKALKFKLAYVAQFEAMKAELQKRPAPLDPMKVLNDPAALRGLLGNYAEKVLALESKVEQMQPQVDQLARIENTVGSLCLRDAAKTLKVQPLKLNAFMQARQWVYKRQGNVSWVGYQVKIQAGLLEHRDYVYTDSLGQERVRTQVMVTGKGLVKLAELLNQPLQ